MSNQNDELKQRLKKFVDFVAVKKGTQWAKETQAELKATERMLSSINQDDIEADGVPVSLGKTSGLYLDPNIAMIDETESTFFPSGNRITPHDTGNLIEAISASYKKQGKSYLFSVGVDYQKLNRPRYLYSWLYNRHGRPGVYVKRPGKNTSGAYVRAANRNSDERPNFLQDWDFRGQTNVRRIFK